MTNLPEFARASDTDKLPGIQPHQTLTYVNTHTHISIQKAPQPKETLSCRGSIQHGQQLPLPAHLAHNSAALYMSF